MIGFENEYVLSRVRGSLGKLKDISVIQRMKAAPTFIEAVSALKGTYYDHLFSSYVRTGDIETLELDQRLYLIRERKRLSKSANGEWRDFINVHLQRLEIENLKNALRIWFASFCFHKNIMNRSNNLIKINILNKIDWNNLINAPNFESLCEELKNTPYGIIVKKQGKKLFETENLFSLECLLDVLWYKNVFIIAKKFSKDERKIIEDYYNYICDIKNCLFIARAGFLYSKRGETLKEVIIPFGSKVLNSNYFKDFLNNCSVESYCELLKSVFPTLLTSKYPTFVLGEDSGSQIKVLEDELLKIQREKASKLILRDPFSIGILIAYFEIYKVRDAEIRTILYDKEFTA